MAFNPTVVFDFDGVIHSYRSGWKGATVIPDPVVPGIKEEIERFRRFGYRVVVVSTRCSTMEGLAAVEDYLAENRIEVDAVQMEKPPAVCYIDDRALTFRGNPHGLVEQVGYFKTWTERDPIWDEGVKGLRPCMGESWENGKKVKVFGHFHGWGSNYEEFNDGVANFTYAMVEVQSGKIVPCIADTLVFIDRTGSAMKPMGEWVVHTEHFTPYRRCSLCGYEIPLIANTDEQLKLTHCPECTARMMNPTLEEKTNEPKSS